MISAASRKQLLCRVELTAPRSHPRANEPASRMGLEVVCLRELRSLEREPLGLVLAPEVTGGVSEVADHRREVACLRSAGELLLPFCDRLVRDRRITSSRQLRLRDDHRRPCPEDHVLDLAQELAARSNLGAPFLEPTR